MAANIASAVPRRDAVDPLVFSPDTLHFHPLVASTQQLEVRNIAGVSIRFEVRTTRPDRLFAHPVCGVIGPFSSRGVEIVSTTIGHETEQLLAHPEGLPKLKIQYRVEGQQEAFQSTAQDRYWTKKFAIAFRALATPPSPERSLTNDPPTPETRGARVPLTQKEPLQTPTARHSGRQEGATRMPFNLLRGEFNTNEKRSCRIEVFVRIRPFLPELGERPTATPLWSMRDNTLSTENGAVRYSFDGVLFPHCSNSDIFSACGLHEKMADVLRGINFTFFAYGHTGSGKTHTVLGSNADKGLAHRCVRSVFQCLQRLPRDIPYNTEVKVSFVEVYNEELFDLLSPNFVSNATKGGLSLRTDRMTEGFAIAGLTEKLVTNVTQAMAVLEDGCRRRRVGASTSHVHERSSRSHCIFRISTCVSFPREGSLVTVRGEANLVDLAGSEAVAEDVGVDRRETTSINLSLTHLKRVITELSHKEKFVSYRNSTLTKVLKQSLGGNSRTIVMCNATLSEQFLRETKLTLQFGTLAKTVVTEVQPREERRAKPDLLEEENERLKAKIKQLEQQLANTNPEPTWSNEDRAAFVPRPSSPCDTDIKDTTGGHGEDAPARVEPPEISHSRPRQDEAQVLRSFDRDSVTTAVAEQRGEVTAEHETNELVQLVARTLEYLEYGTVVLFNQAVTPSTTPLSQQELTVPTPPVQGTLQLDVRRLGLAFTGTSRADPQWFPLDSVVTFALRPVSESMPPWISLARSLPADVKAPPDAEREIVHFACRTFEDHEGWVLCLSRLLGGQLPKYTTPAQFSLSNDCLVQRRIEPEEYRFCVEQHIAAEQYLQAKEYVLGALGEREQLESAAEGESWLSMTRVRPALVSVVSPLSVRAVTQLYLHEAEAVCRFLVQCGILRHSLE